MAEPERSAELIHYDWLIKAGLQRFYPDFAAWLLGEPPVEVAAIDTALPAAAIRTADKLLDVRPRDGSSFLLHLEFQIEDRYEVRRRMLQYAALALSLLETAEHRGKNFASVLIYLDQEEYRGDDGRLVVAGRLGFALSLSYRVIKLWELDPKPILGMECPGLWPFAALMDGKPEELLVKSRDRILGAPEKIASLDSKNVLLAILTAFAQRRIPDRELLSRFVMEIRKMNKNYVFDMLIGEGIEKGLAEGLEKGRREAAKNDLWKILSRRFGGINEDLQRSIEAIEDFAELERLIDEALVATSLEAFLAALGTGRKA